jgi:hypothetical protein
MENRIENAAKLGRVPEEVLSKHKGFSQWDSYSSQRDHDTILQVCQYYHIHSSLKFATFRFLALPNQNFIFFHRACNNVHL